jgi:hypothetical protein
MPTTIETSKISFAFEIKRGYKAILSLELKEEIVPEGEPSIPYLVQRINDELVRITGQRLPDVQEEDRGVEVERPEPVDRPGSSLSTSRF